MGGLCVGPMAGGGPDYLLRMPRERGGVCWVVVVVVTAIPVINTGMSLRTLLHCRQILDPKPLRPHAT